MYRTVIVDECGDIVRWCSDLSEEEIDNILELHSEWSVKCVYVG